MQNEREIIYSPGPVARSREGFPVYQYQEGILAEPRHVVILESGKAVFSDARGRINPIPVRDQCVSAAMLAGVGGILLAGPFAGLLAAGAGALTVHLVSKKRTVANAAAR